eukprot:4870453-Prymnesium_polylepis.1
MLEGRCNHLTHACIRAPSECVTEQGFAFVALAHRVQHLVAGLRGNLRVQAHRLVLHLVRRLGNFMRLVKQAERVLLLTHRLRARFGDCAGVARNCICDPTAHQRARH